MSLYADKALSELLYGVHLKSSAGDMGVVPTAIVQDSRRLVSGCVFVAVPGTVVDGHDFIAQAIEAGAIAIVCERMPEARKPGVAYAQVESAAEALGVMASAYYGRPSAQVKLVGVTGTNGKTTVATLLYQLFTGLGYRCGLISTVENMVAGQVSPSTHTTPEPISLNALLSQMVQAKCTHVFMEVSSHAVVQRRIAGLQFAGGVFTNITHDHLDFHKTFANYIAAKKGFFDGLPQGAFALVNVDDKRGRVMVQNTKADICTYSVAAPADYHGRVLSQTVQGNEMEIDGRHVWLRLPGSFNASNSMAVYGVAMRLGEGAEPVLEVLSGLAGAPGRFEVLRGPKGQTAIVDYAHTPDALKNVLTTIGLLRTGQERIITVFGCGGDRDKTKRPEMGAIVAKLSDKVVVTSDNPRTEEPLQIISAIVAGVPISARKKILEEADRREAIAKALRMASPQDIVLVAGKGHETYQDIGGVKHPFDDRQTVREIYASL